MFAVLCTLVAPSLVAFAFSGADALSVEGAIGTACLFAPAASLFAGISLASGDRGGEGLAPLLRAPLGPTSVLAAGAAGIAFAGGLGAILALAAGLAALAAHQGLPPPAAYAGPIVSSLALAPATAAVGLLLGILAPRTLAATLGAVLLAAGLAVPAGFLPGLLPRPDAFLLSRDAAFGALPASAVLLSSAASLALGGAAVAAGVAVLRGKDLAPRPGHP